MKRRAGIFTALFVILIVVLVSGRLYYRVDKGLEVESVELPGAIYTFLGETPQYAVDYDIAAKGPKTIRIRFSQPLDLDPKDVIVTIQNGHYLPIRSESYRDAQGKPSALIYSVQANTLHVRSTQGELPMGLFSIYLDEHLKDKAGNHLGQPVEVRLSSAYPSVVRFFTGKPGNLVPLPASGDDRQAVGYVLKDATLFDGLRRFVRQLHPGDSFYVLGEANGMTKVRAFQTLRTLGVVRDAGFGHILKDYARAIDGYVQSDLVYLLQRPSTPGAMAVVTSGPVLTVYMQPAGLQYVELEEPVQGNLVAKLEALCLLDWSDFVGGAYYAESYDSSGTKIPFFSKGNGQDIRALSVGEYQLYSGFRDRYIQQLNREWEYVQVADQLTDEKRQLTDSYLRRREGIQVAWEQWVRGKDQSPRAFVDRLALLVPEGEQQRVTELFEQTLSRPDDSTYFEAMTTYLNTYASPAAWVQRVVGMK